MRGKKIIVHWLPTNRELARQVVASPTLKKLADGYMSTAPGKKCIFTFLNVRKGTTLIPHHSCLHIWASLYLKIGLTWTAITEPSSTLQLRARAYECKGNGPTHAYRACLLLRRERGERDSFGCAHVVISLPYHSPCYTDHPGRLLTVLTVSTGIVVRSVPVR